MRLQPHHAPEASETPPRQRSAHCGIAPAATGTSGSLNHQHDVTALLRLAGLPVAVIGVLMAARGSKRAQRSVPNNAISPATGPGLQRQGSSPVKVDGMA